MWWKVNISRNITKLLFYINCLYNLANNDKNLNRQSLQETEGVSECNSVASGDTEEVSDFSNAFDRP